MQCSCGLHDQTSRVARASKRLARQGLQKWWPQGVDSGSVSTPLHSRHTKSRSARSCSLACATAHASILQGLRVQGSDTRSCLRACAKAHALIKKVSGLRRELKLACLRQSPCIKREKLRSQLLLRIPSCGTMHARRVSRAPWKRLRAARRVQT